MILFKNFERLDVNCRGGIAISKTQKGLKIETYSVYTDQTECIFYIKETEEFNSNTIWDASWNENYTFADIFIEQIKSDVIKPYKTISKKNKFWRN